ncbi:FAD dependent oxidoreductase [Primorskyibacter sedentarius]|uniref:FAD dependent oxidoreductase n=1 Tax=Primorskyibacter sedentarius TaxID=745311 RepID=A0A4R3IX15_9RHOB|nr:FAD-dependent oxidoreductase [Primorskyibacter sedentarius]TCS55624.1 FAD dependent oxidoreductase [Primorskyibacter sedentarius]
MPHYQPSQGSERYWDIPEFGAFDVVVLGGGPAGIAAATTAAEAGHTTLLIERLGFCGGAAVSGMSGTICGLYMTVADPFVAQPQQIIFGFAERFRAALDAEGGLTAPQIYGKTWVTTHDCAKYKKVSTDLLRGAGVQLLYHTEMVDVVTEDDALTGLVLHTRSGFTRVAAKRVIDASGDGDAVFRMGLGTTKGNNGVIQNPSMMFKIGNVDRERYLGYWGENTISPPKVVEKLERRDELLRKKVWLFPTVNPGEILVNGTKITGFDGRDLDVTDPVDHSEAEQFSIYQARAFFDFLKEEIPGCEDAYFIDYAQEVGVRQTRSIEGVKRLMNDDVVNTRKATDSIAKSSWPIELHYGAKPKTEWLVDDYYDVPFATLVPKEGRNVIVAGRCLSAEHEALASCRVTAQCFEYGRAAALAANMSIREGMAFQAIDGVEISNLMKAAE